MRPEDARDAQVGEAEIKWRLDEWVRIIRARGFPRQGGSAPSPGSVASLTAFQK